MTNKTISQSKKIETLSESIGTGYPCTTGRLKRIIGTKTDAIKKIALLGDSTDNGHWVQIKKPYAQKTHTIAHQIAVALANSTINSDSYEIGNFAVDGATTSDLRADCSLNKGVKEDEDHTVASVHQINAVNSWRPDIAVLSVGTNNYSEAFFSEIRKKLNIFQLFFRVVPKQIKAPIKNAFEEVKHTLLEEYKGIIDNLNDNSNIKKIILLSPHYPSITDFTKYFTYTGFSYLAEANNEGQNPFTVVEAIINEFHREILKYAMTKDKEIVFVDITSSLNPLGGNHTFQIELNAQGSKVMGKLIAAAVEHEFADDHSKIPMIRMNQNEEIETTILDDERIKKFEVKKITSFISENRYRHVGLFFSPTSSLSARYVHGYELVMGKQFDTEYTGLFAFGLLDLSLVTIIASYLWRVVVNDNMPIALRITAGIIAAPILLSKLVVGLTIMLALALPIYAYHSAINNFGNSAEEKEDGNMEQSSLSPLPA